MVDILVVLDGFGVETDAEAFLTLFLFLVLFTLDKSVSADEIFWKLFIFLLAVKMEKFNIRVKNS